MATKRKARRFDEGGMTDEDVASFAGTPENESNAGMREAYSPSKADTEEEVISPKKTTFKEAFAAARKAGNKTFQFEGKKFTTEVAGEKKAAKVTDTGDETSRLSSRMPKPELKYQSLADRARGYEAERAKSGVGMYGSTKREKVPVEDRLLKDARIRKSEQTGMGSMKFSKGGSTASRRGDGIAQRGKTRGRIV
jgi:hypothetical protein